MLRLYSSAISVSMYLVLAAATNSSGHGCLTFHILPLEHGGKYRQYLKGHRVQTPTIISEHGNPLRLHIYIYCNTVTALNDSLQKYKLPAIYNFFNGELHVSLWAAVTYYHHSKPAMAHRMRRVRTVSPVRLTNCFSAAQMTYKQNRNVYLLHTTKPSVS